MPRLIERSQFEGAVLRGTAPSFLAGDERGVSTPSGSFGEFEDNRSFCAFAMPGNRLILAKFVWSRVTDCGCW
jgi:hypothetical protein